MGIEYVCSWAPSTWSGGCVDLNRPGFAFFTTVSTQEATNRVKELLSKTNDPAALSEAEKASLQGFCQEIFRRADASELASQLFLGVCFYLKK